MKQLKTGETGRIEKRLKVVLGFSLGNLGIRNATAAVFLVPGADLRKMETRYYKKNPSREVDVLSFPETKGFPHPESKKKFLGEIYLNENLKSDPTRLRSLLIHGLLHLLGYSHDKKRDNLKMQSLEKRLMSKSKIPNS